MWTAGHKETVGGQPDVCEPTEANLPPKPRPRGGQRGSRQDRRTRKAGSSPDRPQCPLPPPDQTRYRERYLFDFPYTCRNGTRFRTHRWSVGSSKSSLKHPSSRPLRGSSSLRYKSTETGGIPGQKRSSCSAAFSRASTRLAIGYCSTPYRGGTRVSRRS